MITLLLTIYFIAGIMPTMMTGNLTKMVVEYSSPVRYFCELGKERLCLNEFLGKKITINFLGEINCCFCGALTKKSYGDGYCYAHLSSLARCDICIVRPELCHYDRGTCREPLWGEENCNIEHYVYLAHTSAAKVGITRVGNEHTRWIDQGASFALPIIKVGRRYFSGLIERVLGEYVADKTNWRMMLTSQTAHDLLAQRQHLFEQAADGLDSLESEIGMIELLEDEQVREIKYPIVEYPSKLTALSLDTKKDIEGTLLGIKGQYLLLDTGVINIRKHAGYRINLHIGD